MLTRLKVNGFKNLVGVDVRFGPFTCIAGANGVGKSNLFDAIRFLRSLSLRLSADGQKMPPHRERSIRVLVKEQGKWLTTAFHNTMVREGEPPGRTE